MDESSMRNHDRKLLNMLAFPLMEHNGDCFPGIYVDEWESGIMDDRPSYELYLVSSFERGIGYQSTKCPLR